MINGLLDRTILVENGDSTSHLRSLRRLAGQTAVVARWILGLLATGLYLWLFLRVQWRIGDEGSIVYGAARVIEGAVPYRDFFEVMGPGTFFWLALWFKALGTSWLTSRVAVLATALVSASAIYYATTRQYRGRLAAIPAALYTVVTVPLWPAANHHFDSNMWVLLAFAVSVSAPRFNPKTSVLTGVLAGLCSTIMPQKGVLFVAGFCIARLIDRTRSRQWRGAVAETLWTAGPFLLVGATLAVFFWSRDALSELIYANLIWPATRYHSVNVVPYAYGLREFALQQFAPVFAAVLPSPLSGVATALAMSPLIFIAILPFVAAALLLYGVVVRDWAAPRTARVPWGYWCAGFALFASEFHRADLTHLTYGSPILLIAVIVALAHARGLLAVTMRRTLVSGVALLAAVLALVGSTAATAMETRSGDIRLLRPDDALDFLHETVSAGEQVFVYPYYPMYYFLANVRNPTRYSILMHHINTPQQFDEVIRDLEAGQVRYVLWDTFVAGANLTRWFPGYQDPPANEQRLERYLDDHYNVVGIKNRFRILQRKQAG
jgi:hypothetical protein